MNNNSSLSHVIMIIKVEKQTIISQENIKEVANSSEDILKSESVITKSLLFLVDLAGSEKSKKTMGDAKTLNEGNKINLSLLNLGNCIRSLSDQKGGYIHFRGSILTRLLQDSLGGNSKTSLIINISPSTYNAEETVCSLLFGETAMKVENKPKINKIVNNKALDNKPKGNQTEDNQVLDNKQEENKTVNYELLYKKSREELNKLNERCSKLEIGVKKILEINKNNNIETVLEIQSKNNLTTSKNKILI